VGDVVTVVVGVDVKVVLVVVVGVLDTVVVGVVRWQLANVPSSIALMALLSVLTIAVQLPELTPGTLSSPVVAVNRMPPATSPRENSTTTTLRALAIALPTVLPTCTAARPLTSLVTAATPKDDAFTAPSQSSTSSRTKAVWTATLSPASTSK